MRTCESCGKPLPTTARTGRPRNTCSDRCRKRLSRQSHEGSYVATPETIALFSEVITACQASDTNSAKFESDTGDGTDVTALITYAKTQSRCHFQRDGSLAATFWI